MIVSFAWTTPALLAGAKTMTRRDWSPSHAAHFKAGMLVDAWDKNPRTGKGRKVATIRITRDPYQAPIGPGILGPRDFNREGFAYLLGWPETARIVRRVLDDWRDNPRQVYVLEFDLVEVVS